MRARTHRRVLLVSAAAVLLVAVIFCTLGATPVTALPKAGGGGSKSSSTSAAVGQPTATASLTSTSTVTPQSTGSSSSSSIKPAKIKPSKSSAARSVDVGSPSSPIVGPTRSLGYWQRPASTNLLNATTTAASSSATAARNCTFMAINPDGSINATQVYFDDACPKIFDEDDEEGDGDGFDVNFDDDDEDEDEDIELSDDAVVAIVCGSIAGAACLIATCLYVAHRKKRRRRWEQVQSPDSGAIAGPAALATAGRPAAPPPMASSSEPVLPARSSTDKPALLQ